MERRTFCRLCNASCGAIVSVEGDRVVDVRGDREHPLSRGYLCPKGRAMGRHHHHPERLDRPVVGGEPVSWEAALDDLSAGVRAAIAAAGPDALAMYKGTAHYAESACAGLGPAILAQLGSRGWYTSLTVDCPAVTLVAELVAGHPWLLPVPDVDATLTVLVGTNPMASHGHTFNVPRPKEQLRAWARQGQLWVIDPRRTETAEVATVHLAPRPGTDHMLLAHLVRELLADGADREYLQRHATGVDELATAVAPFTLDRAQRETGVDAEQICALLASIRAAGRVAMVTGTGLNFARSANVSVWLAWMVSAVTGSLDRPRGLWFNPGYLTQMDRATWTPMEGTPAPGPASRPELPGRFGELPCSAIVDEIEAGNIRALLILGGNPLIAFPQPDRLRRALAALDVLAVVDVVANDVTSLATHGLPATSPLERADVPGSERLGLRTYSQYTSPVVEPGPQRRATWWILAQLARRLELELPWSADPDTVTEEDVLRAVHGADAESWTALRRAASAVVAPERPFGWVHDKLPERRIRLAPQMLVDQLADVPEPTPAKLLLIPRRLLRKTNSTLSDGHGLRQPARAETTLHPDDAARRGIDDGAPIVVRSAHGEMTGHARIDARALRGTVSAPHGFVAANTAQLVSGHDVDPLTGMPIMTGIPVTVTPAPA